MAIEGAFRVAERGCRNIVSAPIKADGRLGGDGGLASKFQGNLMCNLIRASKVTG